MTKVVIDRVGDPDVSKSGSSRNRALGGTGGSVPVSLADSPSIDAFSRLRVSNPTTLMDSTLKYGKSENLWYEKLTGTGSSTHNFDRACVEMTVVEAGDEVIRQTRNYYRYQPGKSQLQLSTFLMDDGTANVTRRVGYFDAENGIFLQHDDAGTYVVKRSSVTGSVVDTKVAQADWNLDTFDELDLTKAQILVIDLQWLGVGRVRVGFDIDGLIVYVHEFLHANLTTSVYMTSAQLPYRFQITAETGFTGSSTLEQYCSTIISEGGYDQITGIPHSVSSGAPASVSGTKIPVLSIRPKATFGAGGEVNRVQIVKSAMELVNTGNGTAEVNVIFDGTLTGADFVSVEADSTMEYDTAAESITGGHIVHTFYVPASNQAASAADFIITGQLSLTLDIDGANPTPMTIAVTNHGTVNAAAALTWQEYQ